ncbi:MAG TPA: MFS transporter [Sphingomicrobium sp.]|nr:MFS transporter [Sphingomicrobium sp.]
MATAVVSDAAPSTGRRVKDILGGSAGNLVEWYDWYAYSALTIYFAPVFFPKEDATAQLLSAAAIFAVGFLMRPIGAWMMGIYSDRHGRKSGLTLSVALMAGGSLMIAAAPTYSTAGWIAPTVLVLARMLQGLSVGGEYGASATYLSEKAMRNRRAFWASFQYITLIGGQLLALAVVVLLQSIMPDSEVQEWGWRVAFGIGAILAFGVYFLRARLTETESFVRQGSDRARSSIIDLWRNHPREFLIVVAISGGGSAAFYAYTTYMQKFLVNTSGFSRPTATMVMTIALVIFMLIQPWWGMAADRWGRKPMLYVFGFGGALVSVPIYSAISVATAPLTALALVLVPLVILGSYTSISGLIKAELFPAHIRTLGVALPYAVGNTLFGGTAEYVALWFKQAGVESGFYWYLSAVIGMAAIGFVMLPETKTNSQILED